MSHFPSGKKQLALLIDPDKVSDKKLLFLSRNAEKSGFDLIFIGGSLLFSDIHYCIEKIKENTTLPVYIFPGNSMQLSENADGILFLSLVSGRNPEFLIGQHVIAAPIIKKMNLKVIPVAYMLIESGNTTSVEYMSNTKPIPSEKTDIILATAMASEMLGFKMIYLEAGSGAKKTIPIEIIKKLSENTTLPIIVGGGVKKVEHAQQCFDNGANTVVIGNAIEENIELMSQFTSLQK